MRVVYFEKLSASHAAFPAAFIRTSSVVLTPSKARHRGLFRKASIPPTFPFHDTRADFFCCPCHLQKRAIVVLRIKKTPPHCTAKLAMLARPSHALGSFKKISAPHAAFIPRHSHRLHLSPQPLKKSSTLHRQTTILVRPAMRLVYLKRHLFRRQFPSMTLA